MRTFSLPDRLLRHIPDEPVWSWDRIADQQERSLRGRSYVVAVCAGVPEAMAWLLAICVEPEQVAHMTQLIGYDLSDADIEAMVASQALGTTGLRGGLPHPAQ